MGEIKKVDELWAEMVAHEERLAKQVYVKDNFIIIAVEYEYPIELARCDTHEKILAWVVQLSDKNWMDPEVLQRFVYLAAQKHGLKLEQP